MRAEQGALFPPISADASAPSANANRFAGVWFSAAVRRHSPLYTGALNVSYTLDAFGGIRRQIEQLDAQAEYQRFELEATDLTLAANVINAAITRRRSRRRSTPRTTSSRPTPRR